MDMTTKDKIEAIEYAIAEAEKALEDTRYEAHFPAEYAEIPGMIAKCRRQIKELEIRLQHRNSVRAYRLLREQVG